MNNKKGWGKNPPPGASVVALQQNLIFGMKFSILKNSNFVCRANCPNKLTTKGFLRQKFRSVPKCTLPGQEEFCPKITLPFEHLRTNNGEKCSNRFQRLCETLDCLPTVNLNMFDKENYCSN